MSKWLIVEYDCGEKYNYAYCDTRKEAVAFAEQKNANAIELAKQFDICVHCSPEKPLCNNPKWVNLNSLEEDCENIPTVSEVFYNYYVEEIKSLEEVQNEYNK